MRRGLKITFLMLCLSRLTSGLNTYAQMDKWQSLVDSASKAQREHEFVTSKKFLDEALREAERSGYNDPRVSKSFKLLGDLYFAQKRYDEAKHYYSISETLDDCSRNLDAARNNFQAGGFADSKQDAEGVVDMIEKKIGRDSALITPGLLAIGKADISLLRQSEAEEALNHAVKILGQQSEPSGDLSDALALLGKVYDEEGRFAQAEPVFKRALSVEQELRAPGDPKFAEIYDELADHYDKVGQTTTAESFRKQAAEVREKELLNLTDYVDKDNGFTVKVPATWTKTHSNVLLGPVPLVTYSSPDNLWALIVFRTETPPGQEPSSLYARLGDEMKLSGRGENVSEENICLSRLPARKYVIRLLRGATLDWMTIVVTREQVWMLQILGPLQGMSSPGAPEYQAAQKIQESFSFLDPILSALKTQTVLPPPLQESVEAGGSGHPYYSNQVLGMKILLPVGWEATEENSPSFEEGKRVTLNEKGTLAYVILAREHLEAPADLYLKLLKANLADGTENFQKLSEEKVSLDGLDGTRLEILTRENDIGYHSLIEVFSNANDHYRIVARAPAELYDRYGKTFTEMLESVEFLGLAKRSSSSTH
jgi:tetratricopeptide repeat protein